METFCVTPYLKARADFLDAVTAGPDAVLSFYGSWLVLIQDFQLAQQRGAVSSEALKIVADVVHSMDVLASDFSDVEEHADGLLSELLSNVTLEDVPSSQEAHLAEWLVSSLHAPQPSENELHRLAVATHTTPQSVMQWLSDARRSIGWEALVHGTFSGDVKAAASTARQVYLGERSSPTIPGHIVLELLRVKRDAEKLRDEIVASIMSEHNDNFGLFDEEDEDTTPPAPVAGIKRRRVDDGDAESNATRKRICARERASSMAAPSLRSVLPRSRRDVSMPVVPTSPRPCTFTLPSGQTLDVKALVTPSLTTTTLSRKRCAAEVDGGVIEPHSKRARESAADASASLRVTQQSLDEIRAAPTGAMLPFDIDSWASNVVPSADLSLGWMPSTFDAFTPPTCEVDLAVADFSDPGTFFGFDFSDYTVGTTPSADDAWAPLSASTSTHSSPRSVAESLSGSDTSLESLPPVAGGAVVVGGDSNAEVFEWGNLSSLDPAVSEKVFDVSGSKADVHDPVFNFDIFDAISQDPLEGLPFGNNLFDFGYGDWSAPQLVL